MSPFKTLVLVPVWFVLLSQTPSATPSPSPSPTPNPTPTPVSSPTPPPSPSPTHAYITLDSAAGGPKTKISVIGSSFPPSKAVSLYWDTPSQVAGSSTSDSNGTFTTSVIPFPGASPGAHRLCGSAEGLNQPAPCATFTLQGAPTPTPPATLKP